MSRHSVLGRAAVAVASTIVAASCSDTPTAPVSALQFPRTASPTIGLSRSSLYLCYPDRPSSTRSCHPTAYVNISNTGGGTLTWTATKSQTWLRKSPSSGTVPSTIKVSVDGRDLADGVYRGFITVRAPGATNSPQTIAVSFTRW